MTVHGENNLFNFIRMVVPRLTRDIPRPFQMDGIIRKDDTPQHKAVREAFTNTAASNAAVTSLLPGERNPSASAPAQDQNAQTRTRNRLIFRFKEKHFLSLIDNSIAEKF